MNAGSGRRIAAETADAVPEVLFVFDLPNGRFTYVNREVKNLLGYRPEQVTRIEAGSWGGLVHDNDLPRLANLRFPGSAGQALVFECRVRHKSGEWVWVHCRTAVTRRAPNGRPLQIAGCVRDITDRKTAEEALRRSQAELKRHREELRALAVGLLKAHEEERKRVSRELHDDLNQKLAMLEVDIDHLEKTVPLPVGALRRSLHSLKAQAGDLSDTVRRIAYRLHPAALEHLGLEAALRSYCADFGSRQETRVRFSARKLPRRLPQDIALCLFRIAQEALRNIARHSGAKQAGVTLSGCGGNVCLTIVDHGKGFDMGARRNRHGLGIIGIQERARLAGGVAEIKSSPGCGTRIQVRVPLVEGEE